MNFFNSENPFKVSGSSAFVLGEPGKYSLEETNETDAGNNWSPPADIYERNQAFLYKLDLPGVKKSELRVIREGRLLIISGGRDLTNRKKGQKVLREERPHGYFIRRLPLPDHASGEQIEAKLIEGVLNIRVRKVQNDEPENDYPEKIEVNID